MYSSSLEASKARRRPAPTWASLSCTLRSSVHPSKQRAIFSRDDVNSADAGDACVVPDETPPELDRESISASMAAADEDAPDGSGTITVTFMARDDKAGIGTVSYRLMDPQGFSHTGYMAHDNQYGPTFVGDADAWKEYTLTVETARGSPPGHWRLESLDLHDKAGNRKHHQFIELLVFSANDS